MTINLILSDKKLNNKKKAHQYLMADNRAVGLQYKGDIFVRLHKLKNYMPIFDRLFKEILAHEAFHKCIREEKIEYSLGEEYVIYRTTGLLSKEEINSRLNSRKDKLRIWLVGLKFKLIRLFTRQ